MPDDWDGLTQREATKLERRFSFDQDPSGYDRWRPEYPPQLIQDILRYAGRVESAIEVGMGTGLATLPFLQIGCRLTALEPGAKLAAYAKSKFSAYPNLTVKQVTFEDFEGEGGKADLIYAASSFHWVTPDIGYPKALGLLKSGGTLAVFRACPSPAPGDVAEEIDRVYDRYSGYFTAHLPGEMPYGEQVKDNLHQYGFVQTECKTYVGWRTFTAGDYILLLRTYSDHMALPPEVKERFEEEMHTAIAAHGGRVELQDTFQLHLGRKP